MSIEPAEQNTAALPVPAAQDDTGTEPAPAPGPSSAAVHPARRAGRGAGVARAVGGALNFLTLAARITALSADALRLKENLWALQRRMEENAGRARTLSEMCDAAEVEAQYTALIMEASTALQRVAEASGELAETADVMEANARGFNDAHETEYRGVYEAATASGVQQPKPGFNRVR